MKDLYKIKIAKRKQNGVMVTYNVWPSDMVEDFLAEGFEHTVFPPDGEVEWSLCYFFKDGKSYSGMIEPEDYEKLKSKEQ